MNRGKWLPIIVLIGSLAPAAQAQYGGLARALGLFDVQLSGERNVFGDGFTINGAAFYNGRRFNFGLADLTLTGQMTGSVGITRRGLPAAEFNLSTPSIANGMDYTFNFNNGIQDLTATGTVGVNIRTSINALGFYDQTIQISNRGTYATDGFGVVDSGTLDFDVGPIDVHGNIFADAIAVLTQPLFDATGTDNPFAKFSGKATKAIEANQKVEQLRARIDAGEVLSDDEIAVLVNNTVLAAMLGGQPDNQLLEKFVAPDAMLKQILASGNQSVSLTSAIPEPSAALLLLASVPLLRRRKAG